MVLIKHETAAAFIAPMPVRKIFGIGKSAEAMLLQYGIDTIGKIAAADISILQKVFGINAQAVHNLACGIDNSPVVNETEAKSIGKEHTYDKDLYEEADLEKSCARFMRRNRLAVKKAQINRVYGNFKS